MELETTWQAIPIAERDRAMKVLIDLKPGEPFDLETKVSPKNKERFLTVLKYFHKWDATHYGFDIEFISKNQIVKVAG